MPLEESLKLFQEGTELVRSCGKLLDDAQLQIQKVMTAADGSPVMEDFIDEKYSIPNLSVRQHHTQCTE